MPPGSPRPLQPSLPLQIPPAILTPKPSRMCPKHKPSPPTAFQCPAMQLETHGQLLGNCCHLPAQLHPPRPPSFQTSSNLLIHAQDPFLPHPPILSPFLPCFILGKYGRTELFPRVFLDSHPSPGSLQIWSSSQSIPRGCVGLYSTLELDMAVTLKLFQAPAKDITTV